ncbi:hypothetical protein BU17DRAFT_85998 [Hysterangium stoloniferum]|nr:hypothetical protein BU17DRAFT_85998 [Hysterangium stoloniferum]
MPGDELQDLTHEVDRLVFSSSSDSDHDTHQNNQAYINDLECQNIDLKRQLAAATHAATTPAINANAATTSAMSQGKDKVAEWIHRIAGKYTLMYVLWIGNMEVSLKMTPDPIYHPDDRFKHIEGKQQGEYLDLLKVLPPDYCNPALVKNLYFQTHFKEGMNQARSDAIAHVHRICGLRLFNISNMADFANHNWREKNYREFIGWVEGDNGKSYYEPFAPILHHNYCGKIDINKLFLNLVLIQVYKAIIHGPGSLDQPNNVWELKESKWGISEITPGAIAVTAICARFALSHDAHFQRQGSTTHIDYEEDFYTYLEFLSVNNGIVKKILNVWNEQLYGVTNTKTTAIPQQSQNSAKTILAALKATGSHSEDQSVTTIHDRENVGTGSANCYDSDGDNSDSTPTLPLLMASLDPFGMPLLPDVTPLASPPAPPKPHPSHASRSGAITCDTSNVTESLPPHRLNRFRSKRTGPEQHPSTGEVVVDESRKPNFEPPFEAVITTIVALLKESNFDVRSSAVSILGMVSEQTRSGATIAPVIPNIVTLLKDSDSDVQSQAVSALEKVSEQAEPRAAIAHAIPDIVALLKHSDNSVQQFTQTFDTAKFRAAIAPAIPNIVALLNNSHHFVQVCTVVALVNVSKQAEFCIAIAGVIPDILSLLKDSEPFFQSCTVHKLVNFSEQAEFQAAIRPGIPNIVALLKDSDCSIQSSTVSTLAKFLEKARWRAAIAPAITHVVALLKDSDSDVRASAISVLGVSAAPHPDRKLGTTSSAACSSLSPEVRTSIILPCSTEPLLLSIESKAQPSWTSALASSPADGDFLLSHPHLSDFQGNEHADTLAEQATSARPVLHLTRERAKVRSVREWDRDWAAKLHSNASALVLTSPPLLKLSPIHKDFPGSRAQHTRLIQAITGHGFLGEYYSRFLPNLSTACPCGSTPLQTREHILTSCSLFEGHRSLLCKVSRGIDLAFLLGMKSGLRAVSKFICQTAAFAKQPNRPQNPISTQPGTPETTQTHDPP